MNRAFRKRIQRLLDAPRAARGDDDITRAAHQLHDEHYRTTLSLLVDLTPERAPTIARALAASLMDATEQAWRLAAEKWPEAVQEMDCRAGCAFCCQEARRSAFSTRFPWPARL